MKTIRMVLGRNVRQLRRVRGYTLEELSDMAGIHPTFLGHIELGNKAPSIKTIIRVARALKVRPAVLLRGVR